jgi:hypothetical protein
VDPASLTVETVLVHGTEDVNVPVGNARWVVAHVPSARLISTGDRATCSSSNAAS